MNEKTRLVAMYNKVTVQKKTGRQFSNIKNNEYASKTIKQTTGVAKVVVLFYQELNERNKSLATSHSSPLGQKKHLWGGVGEKCFS